MSTEENLSLLEKLDRRGAQLRRRAIGVAWGSVIAAVVVVAILISVAYRELSSAYQQLSAVHAEVKVETNKLSILKIQKDTIEKELVAARLQRDNYQSIVQSVPKETAIAAAQQATSKSSPAALLPRIYLHIVNDADREYAKRQAKFLEENGFVVLGVEYVKNVTLKNTQVRFYTESQRPVAERILNILKKHGEESATLNNLRLENVAKTRPNQYEVWFTSQAARGASDRSPPTPSKAKS